MANGFPKPIQLTIGRSQSGTKRIAKSAYSNFQIALERNCTIGATPLWKKKMPSRPDIGKTQSWSTKVHISD